MPEYHDGNCDLCGNRSEKLLPPTEGEVNGLCPKCNEEYGPVPEETVLKCTKETIINVDAYDLETFLKKVTGHAYEIQGGEEWTNDSQHRFVVTGNLASWQEKDWESFKSKGDEGCTLKLRAYLEGLCKDGHIEPGTYIVSLSY